jgi:ABC-type transport system substrate-binding protein
MGNGGGAQIGTDAMHIGLTLNQGILDPLSLMDFKVVPDRLTAIINPEFAKNPIGSGPYKFESRDEKSCTFVANLYYEGRPGKKGLPAIREIQFVRSADPGKEFQGKSPDLRLLLDVPPERYRELHSLQGIHWAKLRNQRIYFLAVNHRRTDLQNEPLRKAIAYAVNRSAILKDCFISGRALNGPFPPGSWACQSMADELSDATRAKAQTKAAKLPARKLSLKYPSDDTAVKTACEKIRDHVAAATGIDLLLEPLSMRELKHDVEEIPEYDLAYYSYDYPTPAYWLWPLFDPQASKGRNYLGYQNAQLESYFRKMLAHRDFAVVRAETHSIHALMNDQMPLIPLWQLDTYVAIHDSVKCPELSNLADPLLIFSDIEKWKIER